MKTRTIPVLAALAGALGCAPNHVSLELFGLCAPPAAVAGQACQGPSGACSTYLAGRPHVYLQYKLPGMAAASYNQLELWLEVRNQLPNNADQTAGRVNTNDATVEQFVLEYSGPISGTYTYPSTTTVAANSTTAVAVPLVPSDVAAAMVPILMGTSTSDVAATVTVNVKLKGHLKDASTFETGAFPVAVDVSTAVWDPTLAQYNPCPTGQALVPPYGCLGVGQTASYACAAP